MWRRIVNSRNKYALCYLQIIQYVLNSAQIDEYLLARVFLRDCYLFCFASASNSLIDDPFGIAVGKKARCGDTFFQSFSFFVSARASLQAYAKT